MDDTPKPVIYCTSSEIYNFGLTGFTEQQNNRCGPFVPNNYYKELPIFIFNALKLASEGGVPEEYQEPLTNVPFLQNYDPYLQWLVLSHLQNYENYDTSKRDSALLWIDFFNTLYTGLRNTSYLPSFAEQEDYPFSNNPFHESSPLSKNRRYKLLPPTAIQLRFGIPELSQQVRIPVAVGMVVYDACYEGYYDENNLPTVCGLWNILSPFPVWDTYSEFRAWLQIMAISALVNGTASENKLIRDWAKGFELPEILLSEAGETLPNVTFTQIHPDMHPWGFLRETPVDVPREMFKQRLQSGNRLPSKTPRKSKKAGILGKKEVSRYQLTLL